MKRGDVVLIRFPFTNLSSSKVRPALVISSDGFSNRAEDAIFIFISSNTDKPQPTDLLLDQNHSEFAGSGLKQSSLIKTGKIASLSKSLASRLLGQMSQNTMHRINKNLMEILDLN